MGFEEIHIGLYWKPVIDFYKINKLAKYKNRLPIKSNELICTGKKGRPRKTLVKGVKVRIKNKGSQAHKKGSKRPKYQAPHLEHPQTVQYINNTDIHANHCEAFNSDFRRRTNIYSKNESGLQRTLDVTTQVYLSL